MNRSDTTGSLLFAVTLATLAAATGCSGDDTAGGDQAGTEFINEVTLTLMRRQDSTFQSAVITDPDGPGPLPPGVQSGTLRLVPNSSYTATITLTNTMATPPIDVTPLINARKPQHRFFYTVLPEGGVLATDLTIDSNGAWYGEAFAVHVPAAVESREWTLKMSLSHYEGDTKGDGLTPSALTDIEVTFVLTT